MQKTLVGILTVTTIALAILCAVQSKQLRAANELARMADEARNAEAEAREAQVAHVRALERSKAELDRQVQQFTSITTRLHTNETALANQVATLTGRVKAGAGGTGAADGSDGEFGKGMGDMIAKMMKDPAMREVMREQQKAAIGVMYAGMFKELKLSPDEKEKLKGLLTDAQMRTLESAQGLFGGKADGAIEDTTKQIADAKKQTDDQVEALLGKERFVQYEDYQKNLGERMQLDQLQAQLTSENLPLQDQQMAHLLQAMKDEKLANPPAIPTDQTQLPKKEYFTAENLDKQMKWMDDYNRRVLDRAGKILSPEQLKQYQSFQDQQTSMQKLGLNMARQMFGDKPAAPPAPVPVK